MNRLDDVISPEFLQQVTRYLAELYPAEDAPELAARCFEAVGIDMTHALSLKEVCGTAQISC